MNDELRRRIARIEISLNYCGGYYDVYDGGYDDDHGFDPHHYGPDRHRIERLAHELETATDRLYKVAKRDIRHGTHGYSTRHSAKVRRKTWDHVKDLETVGDSFYRLARDYGTDIYHIEKLYARAEKELHSIEHGVEYFGEPVHSQFYEVERLMRRMGQALEGRRHSSVHRIEGRRLTQVR